jgi:hypothetical protein
MGVGEASVCPYFPNSLKIIICINMPAHRHMPPWLYKGQDDWLYFTKVGTSKCHCSVDLHVLFIRINVAAALSMSAPLTVDVSVLDIVAKHTIHNNRWAKVTS